LEAPADPRVAVVVPVFNKAAFVAETLRSVMRQTYPEIELIVVDDGSTDGSPDIVRRTLGDFPVRFVQLTNGGVSRARNVGAAEASNAAKYLLFLDADDLLAEGAIAAWVGHLERHPEAAVCYCRLRCIDADGKPLTDRSSDLRWASSRFGRRRVPDDSPVTPLEAVWTQCWAIPSCCLVRRDGFAVTNGWDRGLCPPATVFTAEDKDMTIQLALQGELHRLPDRLVEYRVMPSAHSAALNDGLKALNVKWWSAELNDETRARVRRAIRFEYKSAAADAMTYFLRATRHPRTRNLPDATSYLAQATLRWALTGRRMERQALRG
jgi:GT2 family glycosyltransferase